MTKVMSRTAFDSVHADLLSIRHRRLDHAQAVPFRLTADTYSPIVHVGPQPRRSAWSRLSGTQWAHVLRFVVWAACVYGAAALVLSKCS